MKVEDNEGRGSADGGTSLVDLINELVEPPAPVPVSMTPQTAGWLVLAVLVAAVTVVLVYTGIRRWRANAYRRAALAGLDRAGDDPAAIAMVLRRTALAVWPRHEVAHLVGSDWLAFLDATGGNGTFSGPTGQDLVSAPYRREAGAASRELQLAARHWVRGHQRHSGRPQR